MAFTADALAERANLSTEFLTCANSASRTAESWEQVQHDAMHLAALNKRLVRWWCCFQYYRFCICCCGSNSGSGSGCGKTSTVVLLLIVWCRGGLWWFGVWRMSLHCFECDIRRRKRFYPRHKRTSTKRCCTRKRWLRNCNHRYAAQLTVWCRL